MPPSFHTLPADKTHKATAQDKAATGLQEAKESVSFFLSLIVINYTAKLHLFSIHASKYFSTSILLFQKVN